jgi:two-component system LytT family response regulator
MLRNYRALVVDDNELARFDLIELLKKFPTIEVVGEARSIAAAVKAINELSPDLIFLDIQFPGESGFDLFDKIEVKAKVVFVSAFDEYALRAFTVNALDYLMKPVSAERLAQTIDRLEQKIQSSIEGHVPLEFDDLLFIEMNSRFQFLRVSSILKISSAGMYTEVTTVKGQKGLVDRHMKEWEARLPQKYFIRIHRTTIINVDYVEKIEEWFNYNYRVYLRGVEKPLAMSRRSLSKLKDRMS